MHTRFYVKHIYLHQTQEHAYNEEKSKRAIARSIASGLVKVEKKFKRLHEEDHRAMQTLFAYQPYSKHNKKSDLVHGLKQCMFSICISQRACSHPYTVEDIQAAPALALLAIEPPVSMQIDWCPSSPVAGSLQQVDPIISTPVFNFSDDGPLSPASQAIYDQIEIDLLNMNDNMEISK